MSIKERYASKLASLEIEGLRGGDPNDASVPCAPPTPISQKELSKLERRLGINMPDDYRQFLLEIGAASFGRLVSVRPIQVRGSYELENFDLFYGGAQEDEYGLLENIEIFRGRIPSAFIPIASNGFGGQYCLGIAGDERGKVYLWDHEDERTDETYVAQFGKGKPAKEWLFGNLYLVASSFTDFLDRLEPSETN